jgi:hypothetical protein
LKRLTALVASAALTLGVSYLVSCSDPLDVSGSFGGSPGGGGNRVDTVIIFDTVTVTDTNNTVDTLIIIDTVITIDTNYIVDTVTITQPDSGQSETVCGRISCNKKEIVWMFRNREGFYHLEFSASTERDKPIQTLVVTIDGQPFTWIAAENPELITDMHLSHNASIRISLEDPGAYGHAIDVCLKMTAQ